MSNRAGTLQLPARHAEIARNRLARSPATEPPPAPAASSDQRLHELRTSARTLKVTMVIDGAPLAGLTVPDGTGRVTLHIDVAGRVVRVSLSAKSIRKVVAAIDAAGPSAVAVVLSGRLQPDDNLADAGIVVQPRSPKPPPPEPLL